VIGRSKRRPCHQSGYLPVGVHRDFKPASQRLAELIARHKEALAMRGARRMKLRLLRIRFIMREPIFIYSSFLFGEEALGQNLDTVGRKVVECRRHGRSASLARVRLTMSERPPSAYLIRYMPA
jgi:hypothetical protein